MLPKYGDVHTNRGATKPDPSIGESSQEVDHHHCQWLWWWAATIELLDKAVVSRGGPPLRSTAEIGRPSQRVCLYCY